MFVVIVSCSAFAGCRLISLDTANILFVLVIRYPTTFRVSRVICVYCFNHCLSFQAVCVLLSVVALFLVRNGVFATRAAKSSSFGV